MGGPSDRTEKNHQLVYDTFLQVKKEYKEMYEKAGKQFTLENNSVYHREVSDRTGYAEVSVRIIVNSWGKPNKLTRQLNKERLCKLLKKTEGVI